MKNRLTKLTTILTITWLLGFLVLDGGIIFNILLVIAMVCLLLSFIVTPDFAE